MLLQGFQDKTGQISKDTSHRQTSAVGLHYLSTGAEVASLPVRVFFPGKSKFVAALVSEPCTEEPVGWKGSHATGIASF